MTERQRPSIFLDPNLKFDESGYVKNRFLHPYQVIEDFKRSDKQNRRGLVRTLSPQLVADPEYTEWFFDYIEGHHQKYPEDHVAIGDLKGCLLSGNLEIAASSLDTYHLTEDQLLGFTKMALGEKSRIGNAVLRGFVQGTLDPRIHGLSPDKIRQKYPSTHSNNEFKEILQRSQDRIVELVYKLTSAIVKTDDLRLSQFLVKLLNMQTSVLQELDLQTSLYILGKLGLSDDTFAKMQPIDHILELLAGSLPDVEKKSSEYFAEIIKKNPFYKDFLIFVNLDTKRTQGITKVYHEIDETIEKVGQFPDIDADDEVTLIDTYGQFVDYPDRLFIQTDPLWFEYTRIMSKIFMTEGRIDSPVEMVGFPDNTVRSINLAKGTGDNFQAARILMNYIVGNSNVANYEKKYFPKSVLDYLRPQLTPEQRDGLVISLEGIKTSLRSPSRGIPEEGVIFVVNKTNNLFFDGCEVYFDQSGRKIRLAIGNYVFGFSFDEEFNLCDQEGRPVEISNDAKLWWENLMLLNLEAFTSYKHEDDIILEGLSEDSMSEAVKITRDKLKARRGHLRREPPNFGYTEEQRNKVFELRWPLPGVETLDLKNYNEKFGLTKKDGQYTYVLPLERQNGSEPLRLKAVNALKQFI